MKKRTYAQYCGLAKALELVGERWALLVIRDLLNGPKRFTELRRGLAKIPTNILSTRLKELEDAGIVRRRLLPRPAGAVVYELTDYGAELDDMVVRLGRWGAKSLGAPEPDEVLTADALILALRAAFRPEAARGLRATYQLRIGDVVVEGKVRNGNLVAKDVSREDAPAHADLLLEPGKSLKELLTGELTPSEAVKKHLVHLTGDSQLLARFTDAFHIKSMSVGSR